MACSSKIFETQRRRGYRVIEINKLTETTIGSAIEVRKALGPGLLESAYKESVVWYWGSKNKFLCARRLSALNIFRSIAWTN
jgi:hypothetical protein